MPTIKDVAIMAGVSITTVSHVINETRFVSDDLTNRVHDAMEELNFLPNSLARSLRSGKSKTIGLVIPDISNLFFADISRKIEDNGFAHDYSVILCNTDDDSLKEASYIDVLLEKQVDGIIFISSGSQRKNLDQILKFNIPVVIADRDIEKIDADIVLVNNKDGGRKATKHLIDLGHKRIGCIAGPSLVTPSALRLEGYKQALFENSILFSEELVTSGNFRFDGGEKAMVQLLNLANRPTAIFACNDMMALGAMRAINDVKLSIPEDISIIGFDNIPLSNAIYPGLSTVEQPIVEMAQLIVNLLVEKISLQETRKRENSAIPKYSRVVLNTNLILRDSTKSYSSGDI